MSVRLEKIQSKQGRWVDVEHGATKGAKVGRDLYDQDGNLIEDLAGYFRTVAIAKDTRAINGVPVEKIITRQGVLIVKEIAAEAIQAGDLGQVVNINGGGVTAKAGGNELAIGAGFGADDLVLYYGPQGAAADLSDLAKTGALIWFDGAGNAYFGGTLSVAKVTENLAGRGTNLLWDEYSRFDGPGIPPFADSGTTIAQSFEPTISYAGTSGSLKVNVNDPTGNAGDSYLYFGSSSTDYNLRLPGGKKYLVHGKFRPTNSGQKIRFWIRTGDAVHRGGVDLALPAANTWGWRSDVIDLTAYTGTVGLLRIDFNRGGLTAANNTFVDQLEIEELVGSQATPSTWSAGPAGRAISDLANDGVLTPAEKKALIAEVNTLNGEQSGIDAQADAYGITAAKTTYDTNLATLNSYLAGLTTPVLWSNLGGNTTVVRTTFNTNFLNVYNARQALLNAISAAAQELANGKVPAHGANLVPNPTFALNERNVPANTQIAYATPANPICDGWVVSYDGARNGNGIGQTQQLWHPPSRPTAITLAVNKPTSLPNGAFVAAQVNNEKGFSVQENEAYLLSYSFVQAWNGTTTANVLFQTRASVGWFDATGAQIGSYTVVNTTSRVAGTQTILEKLVTAPAGATTCKLLLDSFVQNNTGAAWTHDNTVAMRTDFFWVALVRKITSTRGVPGIMVGNGSAKVPTAPSYTASAGTPATATISIPAFTMLSGSLSVAYNAMSVGVSGTGGSSVDYFLYCDDPGLAGGTKTLVATTNGNTAWQGDDRIYLGTIHVTFPTSGTGGGSGSGGGSGGSCVDADAWVAEGVRARDVRVGDVLDCLNLPESGVRVFGQEVTAVSLAWEQRVRLVTEDGAELELAADTPLDLPATDGTWSGGRALAEAMLGHLVVTDWGLERVAAVVPIGGGWVVRIRVDGMTYAAGSDPEHRIFSHNPLKP